MLLLTKVWHSISQTQHDVLNIYGSLKKLTSLGLNRLDWSCKSFMGANWNDGEASLARLQVYEVMEWRKVHRGQVKDFKKLPFSAWFSSTTSDLLKDRLLLLELVGMELVMVPELVDP